MDIDMYLPEFALGTYDKIVAIPAPFKRMWLRFLVSTVLGWAIFVLCYLHAVPAWSNIFGAICMLFSALTLIFAPRRPKLVNLIPHTVRAWHMSRVYKILYAPHAYIEDRLDQIAKDNQSGDQSE